MSLVLLLDRHELSQALQAELETWDGALKAYDAEDFEKALDLFGVSLAIGNLVTFRLIRRLLQRIADSSKILTNMGLIYATLGEHELAVSPIVVFTTPGCRTAHPRASVLLSWCSS